MEIIPTGKTMEINYNGRTLRYLNQCCRQWDHLYNYDNDQQTLSTSGCGIFSLCHVIDWMHGIRLSPEEMGDYSMANGGRGDDGTDRPALLHAMMATGLGRRIGLEYHEDGLRNDLDVLWEHMINRRGCAFCNLRAGHIVAVVDARIHNGQRELLIIDSVAESASDKVREHVREVVPQSLNVRQIKTSEGLLVGTNCHYGMFWVDASLPMDFNLLYKIDPTEEGA